MSRDEQKEIDKVNKLQNSWGPVEAPLWLHMLGYADCEVEKYLIRKETETLKQGICTNFACRHKNESETTICSKMDCPLMEESSPFTFPFSDGRRPVIEGIPSKQSSESKKA